MLSSGFHAGPSMHFTPNPASVFFLRQLWWCYCIYISDYLCLNLPFQILHKTLDPYFSFGTEYHQSLTLTPKTWCVQLPVFCYWWKSTLHLLFTILDYGITTHQLLQVRSPFISPCHWVSHQSQLIQLIEFQIQLPFSVKYYYLIKILMFPFLPVALS